ESLVWGRLPIEPDPLDALRFTAAAGLLAIERGDDALANRMLARANTVLGRPWTARVAAMLAVAVASRSGRPDEAFSALQVYVASLPADQHRARPHRLAEAARWALRGGALAEDVERLVVETAPGAL